MISTPTTFVVGAGASVPYGLPAGKEIMDVARTLNHESRSFLFKMVQEIVSGGAGRLNDFLNALRDNDDETVDDFLDSQPEFVSVGAAVIVAFLGHRINQAVSRQHPSDADDWITFLVRRMAAGVALEEFATKNLVRFVTFNYDSVLEVRLARALARKYGNTREQDAAAVVHKLDIVHVHGKLPVQTEGPSLEWLREATGSLRLTRQSLDNFELDRAAGYVKSASVLCFLGFAYSEANLDRLDIPSSLGSVDLYGTAYGLPENVKARAATRAKRSIKFGAQEQGCRPFLEHTDVLRY